MYPVATGSVKVSAYFPALTGLRFLLALWVILHHLTGRNMMLEQWELSLPSLVQSLIRGGYLAVQTFFILSGFVLAQSYSRTKWNRTSLIRFGAARFARIYPVYLLSLLVVSRFIVETLAKPDRTAAQKAALLGDYGFILLGWMGSLSVGWNTPAWSLSCELFFYLCFPLLFLWLRNAGPLKIAGALALSFVVPILLAHAGVPPYWKPVHHLSDFVAGIAASGLYKMLSRNIPWLKQRSGWIVLTALVAGVALITHPQVLYGTLFDLNTALRPLNVAALISLAFGGGLIAKGLSTPIIEYLGRASYSMYILHVPLLWWYSRYALHKLGPAPHGISALFFLAGVIGVSSLAFTFVESPANLWLRDWTALQFRRRQSAEQGSLQLNECPWLSLAPSHTTASKPLTGKLIACSGEHALTLRWLRATSRTPKSSR